MIGIRGSSASQPISDANANSSDVLNGKIFYNNFGKQTGSLKLSLESIPIKNKICTLRAKTYKQTYEQYPSYVFSTPYIIYDQTIYNISSSEKQDLLSTGYLPFELRYAKKTIYISLIMEQFDFPANSSVCIGYEQEIAGKLYKSTIPLGVDAEIQTATTPVTSYNQDMDIKLYVSQSHRTIYVYYNMSRFDYTKTINNDVSFSFYFL